MMATHLSSEDLQQLRTKVTLAAAHGRTEELYSALAGLDSHQLRQIQHPQSWDEGCVGKSLCRAALSGHLGVVRLLVDNFTVDLDQVVAAEHTFFTSLTPLISAVLGGCMGVVELLLEKGCNVDVMTPFGDTALSVAVETNQLAMVQHLRERGADTEATRLGGMTCLMSACLRSGEDVLRYLIESGADLNKKLFNSEWTALHVAARRNAGQAVRILLDYGAAPSCDVHGWSPLTNAALTKSCNVVEVFLESSAVTRQEKIQALELLAASMVRDDMDQVFTYLHRAMKERYRDPTDIIFKPHPAHPTINNVEESYTLEDLDARRLDPDALRLETLLIVERCIGLDNSYARFMFGDFSHQLERRGRFNDGAAVQLHWMKYAPALCRGMSFLFDMGNLLVNFVRNLGNGGLPQFVLVYDALVLTIKHVEQNEKAAPVDKILNIALVNSCLHCVLVCLKVAQGQGEGKLLQDAVERLVRLKPSLGQGFSVLHFAVDWHRRRYLFPIVRERPLGLLVCLLLQCGADPNARDLDGNRPLHLLACWPHKEEWNDTLRDITHTLLRAGALVGVQNTGGDTPLDLAATEAVAAVLRAHYPLSLQSLAATAVVKHRIPCQGEVPDILEDYIQLHSDWSSR